MLSGSVAALAGAAVRTLPPVASIAEAPAAICMNDRRDAAVDLGGAIIFLESISSFPSPAVDCPALLLAVVPPGCGEKCLSGAQAPPTAYCGGRVALR